MGRKKRKKIANKDKHAYQLLAGGQVSIGWLNKTDMDFLEDLKERIDDGESYFLLLELVRGADAYPLKGHPKLTSEVAQSALFRVASDMVERAGIQQGFALPPGDDGLGMPDEQPLVSVSEAAEVIGITRAAVHQAMTKGKLRGYQVGSMWVLRRRSAEAYRDARNNA